MICSWKKQFEGESGSFLDFTRSYKKFGVNLNADGDVEYREWAPSAKGLSLVSEDILNAHWCYSLEISINGTGIHTCARKMTSVSGP